MSNSVRTHRRKPTRLPHPWDSPGKNTRVGCHFLLQCMKVKSESEVAQSCPTLSDPMDRSLPGSSVHGIFQASVLEWAAIAFFVLHTTWSQSLCSWSQVMARYCIPVKWRLFSVLTRKGKVPNSAQRPSLKEPGVQPNWPSDCPYKVGSRSHRLQPRQTSIPVRLQRQE